MSNFKVVNVKSGEEVVLESKKLVAEFVAAADVTKDSVKTIEKKIANAVKNAKDLYNTFKIEENKGDVNMSNVNENQVVESVEEVIETPVTENEIPVAESADVPEVEKTEEQLEKEYLESPEAELEVEKENADFEKRIQDDLNADKPKEEEPKENKRRVGKGIIAFKNGEEFAKYPSIKAAATAFKELMNLPHMPFTPIMKSVRQDIDWNEYSFKHENEADLHIPASLAAKLSKQNEDAANKPAESTETPVAETQDTGIEEIPVEEITEEIAEAK